jgi:hypothetical protein
MICIARRVLSLELPIPFCGRRVIGPVLIFAVLSCICLFYYLNMLSLF